MDIQRKPQAGLKIIRRIAIAVLVLAVIAGGSFYVSQLEPAAPTVERAAVWIDTVKRGPMVQAVRGMGKLVPEEIRWITSATEGIVERKVLEPGALVTPDSVLLELSNTQLKQDTISAEWDLKAEDSSYANLRLQLRRDEPSQSAELAQLQSDYEQARIKYESRLVLEKDGVISALDLREYRVSAEQLANRLKIREQQAEIQRESAAAQLAERQIRVQQRRAVYELRKSQLEQLRVRAGVGGVLQQIEVDVGQRIATGSNLARVANPNKLKAELSVAETQAKDIQLGQKTAIDTRNGVVAGVVSRIDPAVKDGAVTVDVRLTGELPKGARPDLSVDGTIELDRLNDVVYVGLPARGETNSQMSLFRVAADGQSAQRVNVRLGRTSVNTVEILEGLQPGDKVILSDLTEQDGVDKIRLVD